MATRDLHNKLGEMAYENLFAGTEPAALICAGTIRKLGTAATLKRGTIMAKSSGTAGDGKLVVLGTTAATNETLTPDCILTDDVAVGTAADENTTVYLEGNFNAAALTVKTGYDVTEDDRDALRLKRIYLGGVMDL